MTHRSTRVRSPRGPRAIALAAAFSVALHALAAAAQTSPSSDRTLESYAHRALAAQPLSSAPALPGSAAAAPAAAPSPQQESQPLFRSGTTPDQNAAASRGSDWILQTLGALGLVIGLILAARVVLRRWAGPGAAVGGSPVVEVLARTSVGARQSVLLLRLGKRILIVGQSSAGLSPLASVDDPDEVADILTALTRSKPQSISQGFSSLMQRLNRDYDKHDLTAEEGVDGAEVHTDIARERVAGLLAKMRSTAGASARATTTPTASASRTAGPRGGTRR